MYKTLLLLILLITSVYSNTQNTLENKSMIFTNEERAYLKNKKELTVANLGTFPPFNYYENDTPLGYTVDYMNLMSKYMEVDIKFISNKPFKEYLKMLKNNTIDIIPHLAVNEEREKYALFTEFNHIEYTTAVAIKKDIDIKSMKELKDKVIAVTNKSFLHTFLKKKYPNQPLYLAASTSEGLEAVSTGKADAAIGSLPTSQYFIQKNWISNVKTISLDDLGLSKKTQLPMAVQKNSYLLKSILQKVNNEIPYSEIVKLKQKWMNLKSNDYLNNKELEYLKNKKIIKMCVLPDWLPFEQIDENGKHKGIGNDVMKIVSKYIDTPIELVPTKLWSQSLQNIRDRKCDILPVAMDLPGRRDAMNFTKPYVTEPFVVATKVEEQFIKESKELSNKKIGIVKSYAFIEVLKKKVPSIQIIEVKNTKEGLEKVSSGELFGYVDTMPTISYGIQKYSIIDLKIAGRLEFDITLNIASRNDEPILNTIMQKALDSISEEQKHALVGRWVSIKVAQEFNYTLLWQISGVFIIIVLLVLYRNWSVEILNEKLFAQQKMVDKYVLILTTDTKGIVTEVNDAYCKVVGYTKGELIGKSHSMMRHPSVDAKVFNDLWKSIEQNKPWVGEIQNYTKNRETIYFNVSIESIIKNAIKIGYRAISEDITDKKRIEKLSITDQLTQLNNRMKLDEAFKVEIERSKRYKHPFSIILIDIDNFKLVNDTYGHDIGDKTLIDIAGILKQSVRNTDMVGRWGGEEFLVLAPETDLEYAMKLANKIRKNIEYHEFKQVGNTTASFGVSTFREDDTQETLVKKVDIALYKAKENGRNRVEFF
ncbi:transporter substrate-binding domain-containing protein [Sulfurimonas sp.]|uniref:diguanylate cyclase n=1 Tax=Sulfurimonas sp. TaxID=2022749 RepID=UPI0025ED36BD|nr:transporter substrate-binding domain-containing protein [Sulfurimonas sp.]